MPRGSKKRKAAKKKQENQSNNHHSNPPSASSTLSHDVKQQGELKINSTGDGLKSNSSVEREFEFGAKSNGVHGGDEAAKSYNGRSSSNSSSGNSSDAEEKVEPLVLEEDEKKLSSEAIVQSVEKKVDPPIFEENEKKSSSEAIVQSVEIKTPTISDPMVFATQEAAESAFADNGTEQEQEKEAAVTEPLLVRSPCPEKKTSWKGCCGLFEVFSGSGR